MSRGFHSWVSTFQRDRWRLCNMNIFHVSFFLHLPPRLLRILYDHQIFPRTSLFLSLECASSTLSFVYPIICLLFLKDEIACIPLLIIISLTFHDNFFRVFLFLKSFENFSHIDARLSAGPRQK